MTKLLSILPLILAARSPAFAGICRSYADLPNPAFALEYNPLPNHDYVVQGTATHAEPGKVVVQNTFAFEATPVEQGSGITEYRWQNPVDKTRGLLKIKREDAKIVLSIIWTDITDQNSIYELLCDDV